MRIKETYTEIFLIFRFYFKSNKSKVQFPINFRFITYK